jgi:chromosome transmission fidelity protein 1
VLRLKNSYEKLKMKKDFKSMVAGLKKSSTSVDFQPFEADDDELEEDDGISAPRDELDEEEEREVFYKEAQIIFATRTHSQLAQFIGELKKSPFGGDVRAVTLASRANLCVNPDVLKLGNPSFINERCLEMKDSSSKATKKSEVGDCKLRFTE